MTTYKKAPSPDVVKEEGHPYEMIPRDDLGGSSQKLISRQFGKTEDNIEMHVYDLNSTLLYSNQNYRSFTIPDNSSTDALLSNVVSLNPSEALNNAGFTSGTYNVIINIHRKKLFNTFAKYLKIKEISNSRTELKLIAPNISNRDLESSINGFIYGDKHRFK